jgi:membrane associated rhomboid family serine protease
VEEKFGFPKTMLLMLASIVFGNLLVYVCGKNTVAVGLSGGVYGLMGAMGVIYWQDGYFAVPMFRRRFMSTVYINILINFLPNVSVWGHLGGLAAGFFLAMIFYGSLPKNVRVSFAVCLTALVIACGFMAYRNSALDVIYTGTDLEVAAFYERIGQPKIATKIAETCLKYAQTH